MFQKLAHVVLKYTCITEFENIIFLFENIAWCDVLGGNEMLDFWGMWAKCCWVEDPILPLFTWLDVNHSII